MRKIISIALAAAVSVAAFLMPVSAATYRGIDVYAGHSVIDWSKVATQTQFAWIKVSEGENYVDSTYKRNISGAEANGVKWGPYEFLRLYSPESCARQADNFWGRIKGLGFTVIPAVDVESYDNCHTSAQVRACVRAFVDEFRSLSGYNPIIYSYTSYITNNALATNFADCKLWQADYRGYAGATGWAGGWSAWQYSSKGILAGINNHYVDLNQGTADIFMGSASAPAAGSQPTPPKSATKPAGSADVYTVKSMSYTYNATAKVSMQVTDSGGAAVSGRRVDAGDHICITGIDYARQLLEIVYPVKGGYMHGYVRNVPAQYRSRWYAAWRNGRTPEEVLTAGGTHLGTIYPHERATVLYKTGGKTAVLYGTSKGSETKSGLVRFAGVK